MNQATRSRTEDLDMEKCAQNAGGLYTLVLLASWKSRADKNKRRTIATRNVDALLQIQKGDLKIQTEDNR